MKKVLVLDHGNGKMKLRSSLHKSTTPSLVAFKKDVGKSFTGDQLQVSEYETEMGQFVWGDDVSAVQAVYPTYGFQNRYKDTMYRTLTKIALATLAQKSYVQPHDEVVVVTGVPSNEVDTSAVTDLQAAFTGRHEVIVDGKPVHVNVVQTIVIPQPVGTVMSRYLDEDGFVAQDRYEDIRVGIIDIGTGTTDLDSINGLRREEHKSIAAGMKDVYQIIADYVNSENPNAKVEYYHIEPYFAEGIYKISERHSVNFEAVKMAAVFEVAEKIKTGIKNAWKTFDRFDEILLTGGGAKLFENAIRLLVEDVVVTADPQQDNAEGMYRYGAFVTMEE
ncbi:plasmid segregation protein ParM domain-containing protein [Ectobacillus ponti]|uniref:Plasmid segregation protein ParM n=1 Tax=Ectobacillus ponti TaxID=2961894 RepID=A0AA42BRQ5_9BACI|nr:plasmid segregation protein ParM domain-containing protein [Ectobacillus ponti]MCP8969744.1 plasmid segregation protein ParM [Ectobacillus ponti]